MKNCLQHLTLLQIVREASNLPQSGKIDIESKVSKIRSIKDTAILREINYQCFVQFLKQAKLLKLKNAHPVMKGWSNYDFSTFILRAATPKDINETTKLASEESVWLVRAGSKDEGESIALEKNVVGIGLKGMDRTNLVFKP